MVRFKHLCIAKINGNHSLVQPGFLFFASVTACSFYFVTSKSRIHVVASCNYNSQVHCVCVLTRAVKLLVSGTVHLNLG